MCAYDMDIETLLSLFIGYLVSLLEVNNLCRRSAITIAAVPGTFSGDVYNIAWVSPQDGELVNLQ